MSHVPDTTTRIVYGDWEIRELYDGATDTYKLVRTRKVSKVTHRPGYWTLVIPKITASYHFDTVSESTMTIEREWHPPVTTGYSWWE
jgi:hypothetical protein